MASGVQLRAVNKSYESRRGDRVQVLFDISLEARSGEFLVLLGPSGCGKSTTLRLIAGLEDAQQGDIIIDDKVVNSVPASERELAMVFQNYALFPNLSARENIIFGLKARRISKDERERRLASTARLLELTEYLHRRPAQLSGGQRQRVALGRALVSGASLILMDEPLSNLDAKLRQQMRVELRQVQKDLGLTVIYVTHDQVEAMTMADRVVVMRGGRIDQIDSPRLLYQRPQRSEVATFIGSPPMNLFPAVVHADTLVAMNGRLHIPNPSTVDLPSKVLVGIRPEDLTIDGYSPYTIKAHLSAYELLGSDQLAHFDIGADDPLVARLHASIQLTEGVEYRLGVGKPQLHLFDVNTGRRIPSWDSTAKLTA